MAIIFSAPGYFGPLNPRASAMTVVAAAACGQPEHFTGKVDAAAICPAVAMVRQQAA